MVHNHGEIINGVCEAKRMDINLWFSPITAGRSPRRSPITRATSQISEAKGDFERKPNKASAFYMPSGCTAKVRFIIRLTTSPQLAQKKASLTVAALCILRVESV